MIHLSLKGSRKHTFGSRQVHLGPRYYHIIPTDILKTVVSTALQRDADIDVGHRIGDAFEGLISSRRNKEVLLEISKEFFTNWKHSVRFCRLFPVNEQRSTSATQASS